MSSVLDQVAALQIAADGGREAARKLGDLELHLTGLREALSGSVPKDGPTCEALERGREEGERLRKEIGDRFGDAHWSAFEQGLQGAFLPKPTMPGIANAYDRGVEFRHRIAQEQAEISLRVGREQRAAENAKEVEQLRVQLAGCGVAAMDGSVAQECRPGNYGYSASYADVLALRRCMDAVRARIGVTLEDYEAAKYDGHAATLAVLDRRLRGAQLDSDTFRDIDRQPPSLTRWGRTG
jgi:hypothetical protein